MPLSFPLSREAFLGALRPQSCPITCPRNVQHTPLAGGDFTTAERGPALWRGDLKMPVMRARAAERLIADLDHLLSYNGTFLAFDPHQLGPAIDPVGLFLGNANVQMVAFDLAQSTIRLSGLPSGYMISKGDKLGFTYGSGKRAFHQVGEDVIAGSDGQTPDFLVGPHLAQSGISAPVAVDLVKPVFKAKIIPGSVSRGAPNGSKRSGIAFSFQQVLS